MQREFKLDSGVAAGSYQILKRVLSAGGDIEEHVPRSVVENMKTQLKITTDVPLEQLVDLSLVREVQKELRSKSRK